MKKFLRTLCCMVIVSGALLGSYQVFANEKDTETTAVVTATSGEEVPVIKGVSKAPREDGQIGATKRQVHGGILAVLVIVSGLGMVYLNYRPDTKK